MPPAAVQTADILNFLQDQAGENAAQAQRLQALFGRAEQVLHAQQLPAAADTKMGQKLHQKEHHATIGQYTPHS